MIETPPALNDGRAPSVPSCRARYSQELRDFLARLDRDGLTDVVRAGETTNTDQVFALARLGLVSYSSIRFGDDVWRLRFRKIGRAVRKLLLAEGARE